MNISSSAVFVYFLVSLLINIDDLRKDRLVLLPSTEKISCRNCPSVFFIVLDAYTSNTALLRYFNFDNGDFSNALDSLGFTIRADATSLYTKTPRSIAATLNFNALPDLEQYPEEDAIYAIKSSNVINSFVGAGYQIKNYSLYDCPGEQKRYSIGDETPNIFAKLYQQLIFRFVADGLKGQHLFALHTSIFNAVGDDAEKVAEPTFFYVHILAPHAPFVFDATGNELSLLNQPLDQKDAYIEQLKGVNRHTLTLIRKILAASANSIIILQGDHGSRIFSQSGLDDEAHDVFQAYYLPKDHSMLVDGPSNSIFTALLGSLKGF